MEPNGNINGGVVNGIDEKEIKAEVSVGSCEEEGKIGNHDNATEHNTDMLYGDMTKEEFMKNSDLQMKLNENLILSESKMEDNASKSNKTVNGHSSNNAASLTPKTTEKKSGARVCPDLTPASVPKKMAKMSPRATRSSQNPDFAAKQRKFLNRVHDPTRLNYSDGETSQETSTPNGIKTTKEKKSPSTERKPNTDAKKKPDKEVITPKRTATEIEDEDEGPSSKKKRTKEPTKVVGGVDSYCWRCHRDGTVIRCKGCPRVYHLKCVQMEEAPPKGWVCPECITVMRAENTDTRSRAMRMLSHDQLSTLLRFALNRMKSHDGADDFARAVDVVAFPNYLDYIVTPMDLFQLERNIKDRMYGSTDAFLADAKWIVHNSIIFNSAQSPFTNAARGILKICRQEMQEIENCPDCYQNAHTRSSDSWFIEACRRPHLLVWAKLKGFPFWPAKAMSTNSEGLVDVRFFGAHDRAWVPVNCCFLFSKLSPAPASNKSRRNLEDCLQELEMHIKKLKDKFGNFEYPPYKTQYDPRNEDGQLLMFLPKYDSRGAGKRSRMSLLNDGARRRLLSPKSLHTPSPSGKRQQEDTPPPMSKVSKEVHTEVTKTSTPDMVSFPPDVNGFSITSSTLKSVSPTEELPQKSKEPQHSLKMKNLNLEETPPSKQDIVLGMKKTTHRTPLTAAAKKCFAMEEKTCYRCKLVSESTLNWGTDNDGNAVCSNCAETRDESPKDVDTSKDQSCSKCQTLVPTGDVSPQLSGGEPLCADCSRPQRSPALPEHQAEFKKAEASLNGGDASREAISISASKESDNGKEISNEEIQNVSSPEMTMTVDCLSEAVAEKDTEPHTPTDQEATVVNFAPIDSPPKFVIQKTNGDTPKPAKKTNSIVDYLHEKICFAVEEAIKHTVPVNEEPVASTSTAEEMTEPIPSVTNVVEPQITEVTEPVDPIVEPQPQVVLHDMKNDKLMMEKLKENEIRNASDADKTPEIDIHTVTETISDTEDNSVESDILTIEENSKKKKHIDNVVRTLTERKSSVDESSDQSKSLSDHSKCASTKKVTTVILDDDDDNNDDVSVLIIDESEVNSPDSKCSDKSDKSRRKGIPAKVLSRSSSSAESSPDDRPKSRLSQEVLDEVSGKFRRSSEDSNVTITVVTEDTLPPKKANDIRSVNISKSLSLSVVNDSSASLEMECVESDLEEVMTDPIVKKLKPTARKTLPRPLALIDLPSAPSTSKSNEPEVVAILSNQKTIFPQTRRVYGPGKQQHTGPPGQMTMSTGAAPVRTDDLSLNDIVKEACDKLNGTLMEVVMSVMRGLSDGGCHEATLRILQIELEQLKTRHKHEISEILHNADMSIKEHKAVLEADKQKELLDAKHKFEMEKERVIQETKRKTWCTFCPKEATLYCCWNTAYCTYTCQQAHWSMHMDTCSNKQQSEAQRTPTHPTQSQQGSPAMYNMPPPQMHAPDDVWYDEDVLICDSEGTKGPKHVARKRCGLCEGCLAPQCGECYGCTNPKSHTVCKNRRCALITARASQRMRQMMPPPYSQPYRPNQMYTVGPSPGPAPRFTQPPHTRPQRGRRST